MEDTLNTPKNQGFLDNPEIKNLIARGASLHWLHERQKRPVEGDWSKAERYDEDQLRAKYRAGYNIGLRPGEPSKIGNAYMHVVDLDIRRDEFAEEAWTALLDYIPTARSMPSVVSGSGGASRHIYFLSDKPIRTITIAKSDGFDMVFDEARGKEVKKRHWEVSIMGTGRNIVLPPSIHPETRQPYRWERPLDLDFPALMTVPASQLLVDEITVGTAMPMDWDSERQNVLAALDTITEADDRDEWLQIGMALHSATGGGDEGFTVWCDWAERSEKFDEADSERVWQSFKGEGTGLGSLFHIAKAYGYEVPERAPLEILPDDFDDLPALPEAQRPDWHLSAFSQEAEPDLSQDQLARDLGKAGWDRDARYIAELGGWHLWKKTHWEVSSGMKPMAIVRSYVVAKCALLNEWCESRAVQLDAAEADKLRKSTRAQIKTLRQEHSLAAVERLARSNSASLSKVEYWDSDDFKLGTPGGTVDLRTGELHAAERRDHITKQTRVAPAEPGSAPRAWLQFLAEVFPNEPEMPGFIQRLAGYALTGSTQEHRLFLFHGTGRNGKGTLLNTLQDIMGDYAKGIPTNTLLETRNPQHASPIARLRGARLVRGAELPVGQVWNESLVKQMTGGDVMTANLMRQDAFEFIPKFTLIVDANTKPRIRTTDPAMQARMTLIPFRASFLGREDRGLPDRLKAEAPQILRWAIEGAVQWQRDGLLIPATVQAASREYLESEDTLAHFIEEETQPDAGGTVPIAQAYQAYVRWAEIERIPAASKRAFGDMMEERGFERRKAGKGQRVFTGLRLRDAFEEEEQGDV